MGRQFYLVPICLLALTSVVHGIRSCPAVKECLSAIDKGKPCPILPVPKASLPLPTAEQGFNVSQLRPGVFRYDDGFYSTLILYKTGRLTLVDFPQAGSSNGPDGTYLLNAAVTQVLKGEVPHRLDMVYGHRHTDHIGGAAVLKEFVTKSFPDINIFIWGTEETKSFIKRAKRPDIPLPNVIVGRVGRTVNLADSLNLKLRVVGGHTDSDIAAHVLPSIDGPGIMHYVDVLTPGAVPFLRFAVTIDLAKQITVQKQLLRFNYKILTAGHGLLGSKKDVRVNIKYTEFVVRAAREAVAEVDGAEVDKFFLRRLDPNAREFGNTQYVFGNIYWLWRDVCVRKVIERWGCSLAGVDLFAPSHCVTALLFNTIDNHVDFSL